MSSDSLHRRSSARAVGLLLLQGSSSSRVSQVREEPGEGSLPRLPPNPRCKLPALASATSNAAEASLSYPSARAVSELRTAFEHDGKPVTVTKADGYWHVQIDGSVHRSRYLDEVLALALPRLKRPDRDRLLLTLLELALRKQSAADAAVE